MIEYINKKTCDIVINEIVEYFENGELPSRHDKMRWLALGFTHDHLCKMWDYLDNESKSGKSTILPFLAKDKRM